MNSVHENPSQHQSVQRHRLSRGDFHRMRTAGILSEHDRVELIEGELFDMTPIGTKHAFTTNTITRLLIERLERRYLVRIQDPIGLDAYSEPQPDIAIVTDQDYSAAHPSVADTLLVIEVADASLAYDRNVKLKLYAAHDVPEVWLIDVNKGKVEVYRTPSAEGYRDLHHLLPEESVSPMRIPELTVRGADLVLRKT